MASLSEAVMYYGICKPMDGYDGAAGCKVKIVAALKAVPWKTVVALLLFVPAAINGVYQLRFGKSVFATGLGTAALWVVIADWLGGRSVLMHKSISGIYQEFRKGLPPLPPLARTMKWGAGVVMLACVAYQFV